MLLRMTWISWLLLAGGLLGAGALVWLPLSAVWEEFRQWRERRYFGEQASLRVAFREKRVRRLERKAAGLRAREYRRRQSEERERRG